MLYKYKKGETMITQEEVSQKLIKRAERKNKNVHC